MSSVGLFYERVLSACGLVAGLGLALLAVMISTDIVLRNLGILNFPWLLEVSEYVLYVATFIAAPWVLRLGAHVRVDVLFNAMPAPVARVMEIVADLVGLGASFILFWYGYGATARSFSEGALIFKELVVTEWYLLTFLPVCGLLLAIEFVLRMYRALSGADLSSRDLSDGL